MDESQLNIHPDPRKSSYIVLGNKKWSSKTKEETTQQTLMVGHVKLQRSTSLTYLGVIIHENRLSASVEATVDLRVFRVKGA